MKNARTIKMNDQSYKMNDCYKTEIDKFIKSFTSHYLYFSHFWIFSSNQIGNEQTFNKVTFVHDHFQVMNEEGFSSPLCIRFLNEVNKRKSQKLKWRPLIRFVMTVHPKLWRLMRIVCVHDTHSWSKSKSRDLKSTKYWWPFLVQIPSIKRFVN